MYLERCRSPVKHVEVHIEDGILYINMKISRQGLTSNTHAISMDALLSESLEWCHPYRTNVARPGHQTYTNRELQVLDDSALIRQFFPISKGGHCNIW